MNRCCCGHLGDQRFSCRCPPQLVERYRARVSGPLLDRIDMHIEVPAVTLKELRSRPAERSCDVAKRVLAARQTQQRRFGEDSSTPINAAMGSEHLLQHCQLEGDARRLLDAAFERLHLSARAVTRILKVARTIADLATSDSLQAAHVAEAIQYRTLDRRSTSNPE